MDVLLARRPRVLIADDYPQFVKTWQRWLERSCEVVGSASSSREALELAVELKPDVVVLDVMMPGASGLDVCREIKRIAPQTKVILVSAADDEHVRMSAFRLGASAFVLKLSHPEELDRAINHVLVGETYFPVSGRH
jgi:DNA-binding NarL/FixJ family response regulator